MKFTEKLKIGKKNSNYPNIKLEWIEHVFNSPDNEEILEDGRIRRYARINETGKKIRLTILQKQK